MKLQRYLNESLDKPFPYKWNTIPDDMTMAYTHGFIGTFKTDTSTIKYRMTTTGNSGKDSREWEVGFSKTGGTDDIYDMTGEGQSFRVMATVLMMTKEAVDMIKNNSLHLKIDSIYFAASKTETRVKKVAGRSIPAKRATGRAKLYARLVKKYASAIGKVVVKDATDTDSVEFFIKVDQ